MREGAICKNEKKRNSKSENCNICLYVNCLEKKSVCVVSKSLSDLKNKTETKNMNGEIYDPK